MSVASFDRDATARYYASRHFATDPGTREIHHLPTNAPEREIRFLEVNDQMPIREDDPIDPIDFGIDTGTRTAHTLAIIDVTPGQWQMIQDGSLAMPAGWTLDGKVSYSRR